MTMYQPDLQGLTPPHSDHAVHVARPPAISAGGRFGQWGYRVFFKRLIDVLAVLVSLPMVVPLIAVLAILVARDGGRPFYSQARLGKNGRIFKMWKLRSMVVDAEDRLAAHLAQNPQAQAEWDHSQKLRNDPRITRLGRLLRRSSLDELPQLWNVLRGDMSLVGPRPMMVNQRSLYPGTAYFSLRPGLTGYWQISVRNESSFAERAGFDDQYAQDVGFVTDIRILMATVKVVGEATGH